MLRILHFADAHIDIATYGRRDPETGLPVRVMDFLRALDTIVETAITERVDLVIFAGDAFKDRSPAPTYLREWARRIKRLSDAHIPTVLVVGNHDLSPALGRAHALEVFATLATPYVRVVDRPVLLGPEELFGVEAHLIGIPWMTRSRLVAALDLPPQADWQAAQEERLQRLLLGWLERLTDDRPALLAAHASVRGARLGAERRLALDADFVLPRDVLHHPRLDYVALGHIHKHQNLNAAGHPPIVYPGSIERVDFGEADEDKGFVLAEVERGRTQVHWRPIPHLRPLVQRFVRLEQADGAMRRLLDALGPAEALEGALVRLVVEYPAALEQVIDEDALRRHAAAALHFRLIRRPVAENRLRLPPDTPVSSLTPLELLERYWQSRHKPPEEIRALLDAAREIVAAPPADDAA